MRAFWKTNRSELRWNLNSGYTIVRDLAELRTVGQDLTLSCQERCLELSHRHRRHSVGHRLRNIAQAKI